MPTLTGFPFGGGGGTPKATVTSSTGTASIDTTSRPGKTIYIWDGSGSLTIGSEGICEILVIGGGGGGGGRNFSGGGAGGAGAFLYSDKAYLPSGTLTVVVGAGGAHFSTSVGNAFVESKASNGGDSRIFLSNVNYVAPGGGGGAAAGQGSPGGSGGGNFNAASGIYSGPPGILGLGNKGGDCNAFSNSGTGGGGKGSSGATSTVHHYGTNGGSGQSSSITGSSIFYSGGGGGGGRDGGGSGGSGVGGNGAPSVSAGTANRGGGGGGGNSGTNGANGGSGRVVVVIG